MTQYVLSTAVCIEYNKARVTEKPCTKPEPIKVCKQTEFLWLSIVFCLTGQSISRITFIS